MPPQNHVQSPRSLGQPNSSQNSKGELLALPAAPSFALDDAGTILEIEVRADQLLNYIDKLTSFADRACTAAFRQSDAVRRVEEMRLTEIADLRRTVEHQNAKLQEQQVALVRLEQQSNTRIRALDTRLRQKEMQQVQEKSHDFLRSANAGRIGDIKRPEACDQELNYDRINSLDIEIAELKLKLAEQDKTIQAKDGIIQRIENESRAKAHEIERRLRDAESTLRDQETALKAKEALIRATAHKEAEMGSLIKRLSAECAQLTNQLQETQAVSKYGHADDPRAENKIWRRVIGRLQEDPQ